MCAMQEPWPCQRAGVHISIPLFVLKNTSEHGCAVFVAYLAHVGELERALCLLFAGAGTSGRKGSSGLPKGSAGSTLGWENFATLMPRASKCELLYLVVGSGALAALFSSGRVSPSVPELAVGMSAFLELCRAGGSRTASHVPMASAVIGSAEGQEQRDCLM